MRQIERKRLVQFVLLTFLILISLQFVFSGINHFTTRPIELQQGVLRGDTIDQKLYVIDGLEKIEGSQTFTIETDQALGFVAHSLTSLQDLRINGKAVTLNSYAYHCLPISQGETSIEFSSKGAGQIFFFVSTDEAIKDYMELRLLINAFMLFLHLLVLISCFVYLCVGKNKKIAGIFLLYVFSSIIKGINLGELSVISDFFAMNMYSYNVIDGTTTAVNSILPIYILLLLFDIKAKKIYLFLLGFLMIPFALLSQDIFLQFQIGHGIISFVVLFLTFLIIVYGYVKEKKSALPIMILRCVFFVFTSTYLTIIRNGPPISNLSFFFNYAYLGATIYFIGILGVVIVFYLRYNRDLDLKEKEFERIMLLKGLGHDLKHPVLTAKLNNQYLLESDLKEEQRESLQISLKALGRLDKMIENINDYFNQQSINSKQGKISLKEALKKIEENYKNQKGQVLCVRYLEEDCVIGINSLSFNRIMDNLTDNAFKYNDGENTVTISYEILGSQVIIKHEDNGRGLKENEINKVFDMFYRGDENRNVAGLGIGLTAVKNLVESCGGKIQVESKKNLGTVFTMVFPIEKIIVKVNKTQ